MENDFTASGGSPTDAPTAGEARAALDALNADASRLAERVVTPWWYHPILGVLVALAIGAQALPGGAPVVVIPLVIIFMPLLVTYYNKRYGVAATQPVGPRGRRLMGVVLAVLIALMGGGLLLKLSALSSWWALVLAALGFLVTVVLGRRYDDVLRAELANPEHRSR